MKTCNGWFKALLFLAFLSIMTTSQPVHAAGPWYVTPNGSDGNNCLAPGSPCATISGAINKASNGDAIFVAVGTYTGTGNEVVLIDINITLSGGWDEPFTTQDGKSTIDGEKARRGITINENKTAFVDRFEVQNGSSSFAGGIYNDGTLTLNYCTVSGNTTSGDGGGIANTGTLTLNANRISGNRANGKGGGIYNYGNLTLNNTTVSDNSTGELSGADGGGWSYPGLVDSRGLSELSCISICHFIPYGRCITD